MTIIKNPIASLILLCTIALLPSVSQALDAPVVQTDRNLAYWDPVPGALR